MTRETYLALIMLYGIDKIKKGKEIAGSEPFIHTAAIKHNESEPRMALLESKYSSAYVARQLDLTVRQVQKLRKILRGKKKK